MASPTSETLDATVLDDVHEDVPRRARRLRVLAFIVGVPVASVLIAALLLQFPPVATRFTNALAAWLAPWPGATLTAEHVRIRGMGNVTLAHVRLVREGHTAMAAVDTVAVHLRPLALLRGNLVVLAARVVGANVILTQQRDSSWDLPAPFAASGGRPLEIRVDAASVVRSRVEARFLSPGDSVLTIESIDARIGDLRTPTAFRVRIDTVGARIFPPLRRATPALLSAQLTFDRGVLTVQRLVLRSDSSNVSIAGTLLLPGGNAERVRDVNFHVAAAPLDFRDISAIVPGFDVPGSLRLDGTVTGTAQLIAFNVTGKSFDGATFSATGAITRGRDSVRYTADAHVRSLDPQLWSTSAPATKGMDIDASVALAGRTRDSLAGTMRAEISSVHLRALTLLPMRVSAAFAHGAARFIFAGGVSGWASVNATGVARPFDARPSYVMDASVQPLRDTVFGGVRLAGARASAHVTLVSGLVGVHATVDGPAGHMTLDGALRDGVLAVRSDASGHIGARSGSASIVASVRPFADTVTFHVDALRFRDVALTAGALGGRAVLSGVATADGAFLPRELPRVTGMIDFEPTRFNAGRVTAGHITFALRDTTVRGDASIATGKGSVDVTGAAHLARNARGALYLASGEAEGRVALPDLGALLDADSSSGSLLGTFTVRASGTDKLETTSWTTDVHASGAYAFVRVDTLLVTARLADGVLHLDTLQMRSNVARGGGSGTLALTSNTAVPPNARLHLEFTGDTAHTADRFLSSRRISFRSATLTVDAANAEGGIDARAQFALRGLISPGPWADSVEAHGTARFVDGHVTAMNATADGTELGYGTTVFAGVRAAVTRDSTTTRFDATIVHDRSHTMRVAGSAVLATRELTFSRMDVALGSRTWSLAAPARAVIGSPATIDHLTLVDGSRRVAMNGTIDRTGIQDFTLTLDSVPLRGFVEFAGFDGFDGTLDGSIRLTGPATRVAVESQLRLRMLGTTGTLALSARDTLGHSQPVIGVHLADSLGRHLDADGTVPYRLSIAPSDLMFVSADGPIALRIKADSFAVGWTSPLFRRYGITRVDGKLRADMRVAGTYDHPELSGTTAISAGRIEYPRHGIEYRDMNGEFTLEGNRAHIVALRVRSGGTAAVTGDVVMETAGKPRLELHATFDRFKAAHNEWVRLGISGNATITGNLLAPEARGDLTLIDTDIFADAAGISGGGQPVELSAADYRMLDSYFGYQPTDADKVTDPLVPWSMTLNVALGANTWLRRHSEPQLAMELGGSLEVRKAHGDPLQVFGTIETLPQRSYFSEFGRRFQVTSGTIAFDGPPMAWVADFKARYTVPSSKDPCAAEVAITLAVKGSIDSLAVTLGSDPAMETSDVLAYLATGHPAASAADFGGGQLGSLGTSFAAGQVASVLEDAAGKSVGLDVIEVRQNGLRGASVVAGRYVSPRLFVGFEQPLTIQREDAKRGGTVRTTELQLEYTAYRWLVAALQGGQSNFRFFFRVRHPF